MPHMLTKLICCAKKNASYFKVTYLVCREEFLMFQRYLFGMPKRIPHILTLLIWYEKINTSYFNVTYLVCREEFLTI